MLFIILWLNEHRNLVMWLMALVMWVAAYALYFRNIVVRWFRHGQKHSWSVNLATKKAVSHGREEVY